MNQARIFLQYETCKFTASNKGVTFEVKDTQKFTSNLLVFRHHKDVENYSYSDETLFKNRQINTVDDKIIDYDYTSDYKDEKYDDNDDVSENKIEKTVNKCDDGDNNIREIVNNDDEGDITVEAATATFCHRI